MGVLMIFAGVSVRAQAGRAEDDALLGLEQARAIYAALPSVVDSVPVEPLRTDRAESTRRFADMRQAAASAFDVKTAMTAMRSALAAVPDRRNDGERLAEAAKHYLAARRSPVDSLKIHDGDHSLPLASRTDLAAIRTLAPLMAAPELAAEVAFCREKIAETLRRVASGAPGEIGALGESDRAEAVDAILADTTGASVGTEGMPSPELSRQAEEQRVELALATLRADDVRTLLDFYQSPSGREKRGTLIAAFKRQVDADLRQALMAFLKQQAAGSG
ncbi:hypothetical protein LQ948_07620 [Jiella sp. MQZ9-1]|uniref:DUF2059 domain-containing protein n=1 Tax=Jiella flava TaxID=2816857 RepID=A0A939FZ36_9HYPH|nr:hypothetical protein [Jiella flava]MBO0662653.1 hypothetical protein [Jiella flava]MCD2471075.1 hypothetical protein [Jiella flava]